MQETWVQSLGGEDPLEKEMATHSSILASKIPQTEEPSRLQSMGSQRRLTLRSYFRYAWSIKNVLTVLGGTLTLLNILV